MKRILRLLVALSLGVSTALGFALPAHAAGTLTGTSFTASTPYSYTGTANARYDYGFTTASTGTVSRVSTTVPSGTVGSGSKFLAVPGATNNNASVVDSSANSVTGDIDIRSKFSIPGSAPAGYGQLVNKWVQSGNQRSFEFMFTSSGALEVNWSTNGTDNNYFQSTVPLSFSANTPQWVRATLQLTNGTNAVAIFYTSTDGSNWTQLGGTRTGSIISGLFDSSSPVELGTYNNGATAYPAEKIYFASVAAGINGMTTSPSTCSSAGVVACFNPNDYVSGTTFTSSSPQAETWTVNRNGTSLPADIATDLGVSGVTGLPSGGTASYRYIDNAAVYVLPTPTSINASTPCTLSLQGFTNTATPGSYASTLTTYDNAGTPAVLDTGTTPTLALTTLQAGSVVNVAVDPSFALTIAGSAATCNGLATAGGATSSGTGVSLGRLTSGSRGSTAQSLTVGTNSGAGFVVFMKSTTPTGAVMVGQGHPANRIADASAGVLPSASTEAFGYTTGDTGVAMTSGNVAPVPTAAASATVISATAGVQNRASCVGYFASVSSATPADTYIATVLYTAVPNW